MNYTVSATPDVTSHLRRFIKGYHGLLQTTSNGETRPPFSQMRPDTVGKRTRDRDKRKQLQNVPKDLSYPIIQTCNHCTKRP